MRMGLERWIRKFRRVCRDEGVPAAIGRVFHFAGNVEGRRERRKDARQAGRQKGDVLFINGSCAEHPVRYRVLHQMEQLKMAGAECAKVYYEDIEPGMADNYRIFIFYRCECIREVKELIGRARSLKKTVLFDVDDLVVDTMYTDQIPFVQAYPPDTKKVFDACIMRTNETLRLCDAAITTTEALAEELRKYVPKAYINRNTASAEMVSLSEKARREYRREEYAGDECGKEGNRDSTGERIWLGYFSGSATHDQDFRLISPILERLLQEYPEIRLLLVGELDVPEGLKRFGKRIIRKPATDWRKLPELIVQTDINLAPLEDTLFNRAKSELKWFEAALVRVPTVASRVGAFAEMIEDGKTGVLCGNTVEEWYRGLEQLIKDEKYREQIGRTAYDHVMKHCTTESTSCSYRSLMEELARPAIGE